MAKHRISKKTRRHMTPVKIVASAFDQNRLQSSMRHLKGLLQFLCTEQARRNASYAIPANSELSSRSVKARLQCLPH